MYQTDADSVKGNIATFMDMPKRRMLYYKGRKENILFNDTLNTFYLRLYGVRHMVKDHSDSERKPAAATWAALSD